MNKKETDETEKESLIQKRKVSKKDKRDGAKDENDNLRKRESPNEQNLKKKKNGFARVFVYLCIQ